METNITTLEQHTVYTTANDVRKLCQPLFNYFNTTYFNFVRRFPNNSEACLTTNPDWTKYFYEKKLYNEVLADKLVQSKTLVNNIRIYPWLQFVESPVRKAQSELFGIGIGITLVIDRKNHIDYFHIGTGNDQPEMATIYYANAECMVQFTHFFYDKGAKLIQTACQPDNRLFFTDREHYKPDSEFPNLAKLNVSKFLASTAPKRFMLIHQTIGVIYLSYKEMQCIHLLTEGKTAPEIGETLNISSRTVESHLKNVRERLNLPTGTTKAEMLNAIYQCGIDLHNFVLLS